MVILFSEIFLFEKKTKSTQRPKGMEFDRKNKKTWIILYFTIIYIMIIFLLITYFKYIEKYKSKEGKEDIHPTDFDTPI